MRPLRLFRRADERPPLKDRLAALKARLGRITRRSDEADPQRRGMLAGSLAAAIPLPALAATDTGPHPDAELLAAGERYECALAAEASADAAYQIAWEPVRAVLDACPPEVVCAWSDRLLILGGARWPTLVGGYLRFLPPINGCGREAWTGKVLRNAIRQAVPKLGRGGQTPHHVRRWKAMLSAVDAFDAKAEAAIARADYRNLRDQADAARKELWSAMRAVRELEASTPAGLAVLARVCAIDHERGCQISPNLLRSAANVAGINLSQVARPRPDFF